MSKHSLIATGLGLGLMAASMGASAQLHTFDYSSMYYGATAGGSKYVSFVPTLVRGAGANTGAAGVLMLEMFQPVSGSASTWAYALGGAISAAGGGSGAVSAAANYSAFEYTVDNGLAVTAAHFLGDVVTLSHPFSQTVTVSSQACQVTFAASLGTNDQLAFTNVRAQAVGGYTAPDSISITTATGGAGSSFTIASGLWNNASATMVSSYATNTAFSMIGIADTAGAASTLTGTAINAALTARGRCVPAYTARATGGGTTITGESIGLVRIY